MAVKIAILVKDTTAANISVVLVRLSPCTIL